MNQMNTPETDNVQEIDLVELAKRLWGERKFLFKCCGIAIVVGLVVAFSIPKEYSTTVKLAPETSDPSKKMGNLGGLAAMAGINLNSSSGADAISPDLYPDVVQSIPFLLELFPVQVESEKGDYSSTLYEYMNEDQKSAWWSYVMQAPFKLLGVVKDLFSKEEEKNSTELSSFHLTKEQSDVIEDLQERISASVDKKTLVITVS
ncbi:Wzz/FepE/Etk N-terminal domain-containing protein, partial [Parabacteroides segnis]|uniref:Wzz/FepE/Etk N-terminal domain-containing protein n=1 Tax=Parabacteroides segnis TaxID=2763058 RepID=UPI003515CFF8